MSKRVNEVPRVTSRLTACTASSYVASIFIVSLSPGASLMCETIAWETAAACASTLDDPNAAFSIGPVPSSLALSKRIRIDPGTECCGVRGDSCVVLIVVRFRGRHHLTIPRAALEDVVVVATGVADQVSALCGRDRAIVAVDAVVPLVGRC